MSDLFIGPEIKILLILKGGKDKNKQTKNLLVHTVERPEEYKGKLLNPASAAQDNFCCVQGGCQGLSKAVLPASESHFEHSNLIQLQRNYNI